MREKNGTIAACLALALSLLAACGGTAPAETEEAAPPSLPPITEAPLAPDEAPAAAPPDRPALSLRELPREEFPVIRDLWTEDMALTYRYFIDEDFVTLRIYSGEGDIFIDVEDADGAGTYPVPADRQLARDLLDGAAAVFAFHTPEELDAETERYTGWPVTSTLTFTDGQADYQLFTADSGQPCLKKSAAGDDVWSFAAADCIVAGANELARLMEVQAAIARSG